MQHGWVCLTGRALTTKSGPTGSAAKIHKADAQPPSEDDFFLIFRCAGHENPFARKPGDRLI